MTISGGIQHVGSVLVLDSPKMMRFERSAGVAGPCASVLAADDNYVRVTRRLFPFISVPPFCFPPHVAGRAHGF